MNSWLKALLISTLVIFFIGGVLSYGLLWIVGDVAKNLDKPPKKRPENVPASAKLGWWTKDGAWFDCSPPDSWVSEMDCRIYSPFGGKVQHAGTFRVYKIDRRDWETAYYTRTKARFDDLSFSDYIAYEIILSSDVVLHPVGRHVFSPDDPDGEKGERMFSTPPDSGQNFDQY